MRGSETLGTAETFRHEPRGRALIFHWRRVQFTLLLSLALGILFSFRWGPSGIVRITLLGLFGLLAFRLFEQWPRRLPSWLARWVLQVTGVALAMPIGTLLFPVFGVAPAWEIQGLGLLVAPWVALAALVRQKDALARHQALAFDLERSELEREALDARLRLLQAQVAPHFLFNTLANVQALVDAGSPRASEVLRHLIAYLRAAVPRLGEPSTTLGQELQLVRAYLELMHLRIPDRLQFSLHVDETALALHCPPMTLLTLVENAVRHGIDPSEEGGRIDIHVHRQGDRYVVRVSDTGAGLQPEGNGLGTGLSTLRQRLQLAFGGDAELRVNAQRPRGVCAELDLPAREAPR
ncbi:MAG TPA: histidine kinase [Candidatus Binatia bacterium]|nr:histidine kinase [Candidatus Binatia bacterium]